MAELLRKKLTAQLPKPRAKLLFVVLLATVTVKPYRACCNLEASR
jgi:hypothetical protein